MGGLAYKVHSIKGSEVGTVDLDPAVFGAPIQEELVHLTVRWQRAKARAGTHSTLTKGTMGGGGRKPWKQKGTGRARSGSNTSPIWVGGAVAHGPKPRDYEFRLSKRVRKQAMASVLSDKVRTSRLVIVDKLGDVSGKTSDIAKLLKSCGVNDTRVALVLDGEAKKGNKLWQGVRNVKGLVALSAAGANVYDFARTKFLVVSKEGVKALEKRVKCECAE